MNDFEEQQSNLLPPKGIEIPEWMTYAIPIWLIVTMIIGVVCQLKWLVGALS